MPKSTSNFLRCQPQLPARATGLQAVQHLRRPQRQAQRGNLSSSPSARAHICCQLKACPGPVLRVRDQISPRPQPPAIPPAAASEISKSIPDQLGRVSVSGSWAASDCFSSLPPDSCCKPPAGLPLPALPSRQRLRRHPATASTPGFGGYSAPLASTPAAKNAALLNALKEELFALESEKLSGTITAEEYAEIKPALEVVLKRALKRTS